MTTAIVSPAVGSTGASPISHRYGTALAAAVNNAAINSSDPIDIRDYAYIAVKPSAGVTSLTVYASDVVGGTYVIADSLGTAGAVTVVPSKWNVLDPTKIGPFGFIKFLGNVAGTVDVVGKT